MLALAGLGLQAELWFSDDGYRKTLKLRNAVAEQKQIGRSEVPSTLVASSIGSCSNASNAIRVGRSIQRPRGLVAKPGLTGIVI